MIHQILSAHGELMAELGVLSENRWRDFLHVYPGVSRRARGVSVGINLSSDKACNFNCVYCEVDRRAKPRVREVQLRVLEEELRAMLRIWCSGSLFEHEPFAGVPPNLRNLQQIAFSGDGEPTASPVFRQAVEMADRVRAELAPPGCRLVLITDSACLDQEGVQAGLAIMQRAPHQIWAKLDAGTASFYQRVNRSKVPYEQILRNLKSTAKRYPLFIQSLFMRIHGEGPREADIDAYCDRIEDILGAGGQILGLQVNTIARRPQMEWATALRDEELERVASVIKRRNGLPQQLSYAQGYHVSRRMI